MALCVKRRIFSHGKSTLVREHGNHSNFVLDRKITTWHFPFGDHSQSMYQCLHGTAPLYMMESCTQTADVISRQHSAVRQSAEADRSAVSNGQLWSSVFCCCGPVDLEFAWLRLPLNSESQNFQTSSENSLFVKYWRDILSALEIFVRIALYKFKLFWHFCQSACEQDNMSRIYYDSERTKGLLYIIFSSQT